MAAFYHHLHVPSLSGRKTGCACGTEASSAGRAGFAILLLLFAFISPTSVAELSLTVPKEPFHQNYLAAHWQQGILHLTISDQAFEEQALPFPCAPQLKVKAQRIDMVMQSNRILLHKHTNISPIVPGIARIIIGESWLLHCTMFQFLNYLHNLTVCRQLNWNLQLLHDMPYHYLLDLNFWVLFWYQCLHTNKKRWKGIL